MLVGSGTLIPGPLDMKQSKIQTGKRCIIKCVASTSQDKWSRDPYITLLHRTDVGKVWPAALPSANSGLAFLHPDTCYIRKVCCTERGKRSAPCSKLLTFLKKAGFGRDGPKGGTSSLAVTDTCQSQDEQRKDSLGKTSILINSKP